MQHRATQRIGALVLALTIIGAGTAYASTSGETANLRLPKGTTAINPKTCKFIHKEIDPPTPGAGATLGSAVVAVNDLRVYTLYEDARHDVKMSCLAHHMGTNGRRGPRGVPGAPGAPGPRGARGPAGPGGSGIAGYVQVRATGTGAQVTATCPQGDVVLGGGSPDETTGSYPSSAAAWTVDRDHLSPRVLTVVAVCAEQAR